MSTLTHTLKRHTLALLATCTLAPALASAGDSTRYLFDLDAPTILGVMDHYVGRGRYDERTILARMSAPLDCRHHVVLCGELGPDYTQVVLQQVWTQARRGEKVETITTAAIELADVLADRWTELAFPNGIDPRSPYFGVDGEEAECTENVVHADAGDFRLRQTAHIVDVGVAPTRWARSAFSRKNNNGNYRGEKADHIEIEAQFFGLGDLGADVFFKSKAKDREKAIAVSAVGPRDFGTFHVEGCGTVNGPVSLQACACTGPRPDVYAGF
jgi:hypothetical protein